MATADIIWTVLYSITPFQAALVTSLLLFYLVYLFLRDNVLPPGPIGLPFIGYWPFLESDTLHKQLKEMTTIYGDVFSFRVFGRLFIHLGSIKSIKEAYNVKGDCFAGRYTDYNVVKELFREGLINLNGERWKVLRKFFLMKFKEYGMSSMKDFSTVVVQDALNDAVEELHGSGGQPVAITDLITKKCLNVIQRILFNEQGISEEEMVEMVKDFSVIATIFKMDLFLLFGNFAKYFIFPFKRQTRQLRRLQDRIDAILGDVVKRHVENFDGSQVEDVVDSYLKEREDRKKRGDPTAEYFTDTALACTLNQFITDGSLSVGLFVGCFIAKLVELPEEQQKVYEEIMDVVGPERLPTLEDKNKLPYTSAFIYEVMRTSEFFSFFTSMECSRDTEMYGYKIPKGAITTLNFYAANRDPKTFEDPDKFDPSRYLPTEKKKAELPIIFGVGKRSCIGEGFTMIQVFMFITTIVKIFRLEVAENEIKTSIKLFDSDKLKICAIPRSPK